MCILTFIIRTAAANIILTIIDQPDFGVGVLCNNKTNLALCLHRLRTLGSRLDYRARRQSYAVVKLWWKWHVAGMEAG